MSDAAINTTQPAVEDTQPEATRPDRTSPLRWITSGTSAPGSRDGLIDGLTLVLIGLGVTAALGPAYGGTQYLVIGLMGLLAGFGGARLSARFERNSIQTVLILLALFVLASGAAVASKALFGFLPSPASLGSLLRGLVHAWSDVLTTAEPVGADGGLGVIPYVGGFLIGSLGGLLALRTKLTLAPAAPALVVLASFIVLGTLQPQSLIVQGGLVLGLSLGWGAVRANRPRRDTSGEIYWPRVWSGTAMIVIVVLVGFAGRSVLPFHDPDDRYVARTEVVPPFDPRDYGSPLGGLRTYLDDAGRDDVLFEVEGLPKGAPLRLTTMDSYNGVVWMTGGPDNPSSGQFDRVGTSILPVPEGTPVDLDITSVGYQGVWVPGTGATRSVRFDGPRAEPLGDAFRYNRQTGDGATPARIEPGDRFVVQASVDDVETDDAQGRAVDQEAFSSLPSLPPLPDDLQERSKDLVRGASTPYEKAVALQDYFLAGFYSDGGPKATGPARSAPGHSFLRLRKFLDQTVEHPVGNAEQYAAAMALLARHQGLPARVVLGFTVPDEERGGATTVIRGEHADAWVEIKFEGVGWVPFFPTPDTEPEPQPQQQPQEVDLSQQPPPPSKYLEPPVLRPNLAEAESSTDETVSGGGWQLPRVVVLGATYLGTPLALLGVVGFGLVGLKRLRSRRRRTRGSPADRLAGAWDEAVDRARDVGWDAPKHATRREAAAAVSPTVWAGARSTADRIDALIFGSAVLDLEDVDRVWSEVDAQVAAMRAPLTRRQRLAASLNPRTLRRAR